MSKPLVVSIPHKLGKAEAHGRLQTWHDAASKRSSATRSLPSTSRWNEDRMDFRVGAMGQTVDGHLEVMQDQVRVEVQLPWILAMIAEKAKTLHSEAGNAHAGEEMSRQKASDEG